MSEVLSPVASRPQRGSVPNRETLQVPPPAAAAPKLPLGTRPHHHPHRGGHRHRQEPEGEMFSCVPEDQLVHGHHDEGRAQSNCSSLLELLFIIYHYFLFYTCFLHFLRPKLRSQTLRFRIWDSETQLNESESDPLVKEPGVRLV